MKGLPERLVDSVKLAYSNLIMRPEVTLIMVLAIGLTISNFTTADGEKDAYDTIVDNLLANNQTASVANFLEKYKVEAVTALWFGGIYGAVNSGMQMYVLLAGGFTILALDYTMMQAGILAITCYLFLQVKDKEVRMTAFAVAAIYTYFTYLNKP